MSKNLAAAQSAVPTSLPAFAKGTAGKGNENVSADDLVTPQIKVLQAMSPELQEYDDMKAGQLINSVNKQVYNEMLCANLYYETQYSVFNKKARQLVGNFASDAEAETAMANLPGDASDYEKLETKVNYCVALEQTDNGLRQMFPFKMFMKKTQIRVSNEWNSEIAAKYGSDAARWMGVWTLTTKKRSNDSGTWYVPKIDFAGYLDSQGLYDELTKTYEAISGHKVQ